MHTALRKVNPAISAVALAVALLALVASAAGAGYAAATIGAKDIKKNAVTSAKIKKNAVTTKKIKNNAVNGAKIADGSVSVADLPPQEALKPAALLNGGEGDCLYENYSTLLPSLNNVTFRKDRFGTVHLEGLITVSDGPGGDGVCDYTDPGQASDAIAFVMPAGYVPAKTTVVTGSLGTTGGAGAIIAGAQGVVTPLVTLPPGAVIISTDGAVLDGTTFEPAGSSVVIPKIAASGKVSGALAQVLGQ